MSSGTVGWGLGCVWGVFPPVERAGLHLITCLPGLEGQDRRGSKKSSMGYLTSWIELGRHRDLPGLSGPFARLSPAKVLFPAGGGKKRCLRASHRPC